MIEMYERFKEVFIKNKKLLLFLGITIIIVITLILFFYFDIINKINSINSNLNNKIEEKILKLNIYELFTSGSNEKTEPICKYIIPFGG